MGSVNEGDLLQMLGKDKRKAFEMAFDRYWRHLYMTAYGKTRSTEISKDLIQETFEVLWSQLNGSSQPKSFLPFLHGVLRHKVLKLYEKDEVRLRYANQARARSLAEEDPIHQNLFEKELQEALSNEVNQLPPKMQAIYRLKKEEDLSIREIAAQLELSEQTVKNHLYSAVSRLKLRLQRYDLSIVSAILVTGWM